MFLLVFFKDFYTSFYFIYDSYHISDVLCTPVDNAILVFEGKLHRLSHLK